MSRTGKWATLGAVAVVLGAGAAGWSVWRAGPAIDPHDPGQVALGRDLYRNHCAECHGQDLQGEPQWQVRRPDGMLPAPPHDASGHTWHHPDDMLFGITKHGIARYAPPGYAGRMPGFVGILSDAEIRAVLAYIKSTWPDDLLHRQQALQKR